MELWLDLLQNKQNYPFLTWSLPTSCWEKIYPFAMAKFHRCEVWRLRPMFPLPINQPLLTPWDLAFLWGCHSQSSSPSHLFCLNHRSFWHRQLWPRISSWTISPLGFFDFLLSFCFPPVPLSHYLPPPEYRFSPRPQLSFFLQWLHLLSQAGPSSLSSLHLPLTLITSALKVHTSAD